MKIDFYKNIEVSLKLIKSIDFLNEGHLNNIFSSKIFYKSTKDNLLLLNLTDGICFVIANLENIIETKNLIESKIDILKQENDSFK